MNSRKQLRTKGSTTIEFVLISSFFWVPLILGLFTVGFGLLRGMQGVQLTRDAGHMWALGADFSKQPNQALLASQLGQGLDLQPNSTIATATNVTGGTNGSGVVILSVFTRVALGNNKDHVVVTRRIVIGNKNNYTSQYGTPDASLINPNSGAISNYADDASARADNFDNVINLNTGEIAYYAESHFLSPDLVLPGMFSGMSQYSSAIF